MHSGASKMCVSMSLSSHWFVMCMNILFFVFLQLHLSLVIIIDIEQWDKVRTPFCFPPWGGIWGFITNLWKHLIKIDKNTVHELYHLSLFLWERWNAHCGTTTQMPQFSSFLNGSGNTRFTQKFSTWWKNKMAVVTKSLFNIYGDDTNT